MNKQIQIIVLVIAAVMGSTVFADGKPITRIDFNKMIDENNMKKKELHQEMGEIETAKKSDRDETIDFIDVEIGVGQSPSVVDRRFDSIGAAQVVDVDGI